LEHGKKFVLSSVDRRASNAVFGKIRVIQLLLGPVDWQRHFGSAPMAFNIVCMGARFRYKLNAVIHCGMNIPLVLQGTVGSPTVRENCGARKDSIFDDCNEGGG